MDTHSFGVEMQSNKSITSIANSVEHILLFVLCLHNV